MMMMTMMMMPRLQTDCKASVAQNRSRTYTTEKFDDKSW